MSYNQSHNDKTYNTKVTTDISTINNALESYTQEMLNAMLKYTSSAK